MMRVSATKCKVVTTTVLTGLLLFTATLQPDMAYGTGTTTTIPGGSGDCSVGFSVIGCGIGAGGGDPTTTLPVQPGTPTSTPVTVPQYTYTTAPAPEMIVANNLVCNPQGQLVAYSAYVPTPPYPAWNNWAPGDPLPPGYSVP